MGGVWSARLAGANQSLTRFINRFHGVTGFERVVRDYFIDRYKQATAVLAIRLAQRLADRYPNFQQSLSFERTLSLASGGHPVRSLAVTHKGTHYYFNPWSRLDPAAIHGQLLRHMTLFIEPNKVRWVFDGRRTGMPKSTIVREIRRIISSDRSSRSPGYQRWLNALDRIIVVI